MLNQQSTIFPKQLKIDDYQPATQQNLVRVMQTSNLLLGNGGRTTNTAIIIAKCLHMLQQQNILQLKGKYILEFGSGVGLLGIYLGTIGVNVILTDLPAMKDMIQRNINLNRQILKGQIQFYVLNWKKSLHKQQHSVLNLTEKQKQQYNKSTSSSDISTLKSMDKIDYLLACQCGNLQDLQYQLKWLKKQNIMILGYMQRQQYISEQFINSRQLQQYLLQKQYQYQRIQNYHPDYIDQRVKIYKIWRQYPISNNNNTQHTNNVNNTNNLKNNNNVMSMQQ